MTQRIGMTWRVEPSEWDTYKQSHLSPWPELLVEIRRAGIRNYSIFALGTRAFAYFEVDGDPQEALDQLSASEVKQQWDDEVTRLVLPTADDSTAVQFLQLESIFFSP